VGLNGQPIHEDGSPCVRPDDPACNIQGCPVPVVQDVPGLRGATLDPIELADDFAVMQGPDPEREHKQRMKMLADQDLRHARLVWAPVVALVLLSALALIAFGIWVRSDRLLQQDVLENQHKVSVWCYADPNSNEATSEVYGLPEDVRDYCPDAKVGQEWR
jgi:hypothetical protein